MFTIAPPVQRHTCQQRQALTHLACSPAAALVSVSGYTGGVEVWDMSTNSHQVTYTGHTSVVTCAAWSPCGKYIASASWDGTVHVWEALSGAHEYTYWHHKCGSPSVRIKAIAWSPCGRFLASAGTDWTIRVWDAWSMRTIQVLSDHRGSVEAVSWSGDSRYLASAGEDGIVRLWDALYLPRPIASSTAALHGAIRAIAWSPVGSSLAALEMGERLHLLAAPSCEPCWSRGHGYTSASGEADDGHGDVSLRVGACAFTPDGSHVASVGDNGVGYLWSTSTAECVAEFHTGEDLRTLAFLPKQADQPLTLLTGSWEGTMSAWSLYPHTGETEDLPVLFSHPEGERLSS